MDLKVEHWIMRCLEKNPRSRPSALEIASAISGGNALATALAAGETPSPEMVAASPGERVLSPLVITLCFLAFLVSISLMVVFSGRGQLHRVVPLEFSPEVLADRANLLMNCPLTSDFYAWYASGTILTLLVGCSLAGYAFYTALAGRPLRLNR